MFFTIETTLNFNNSYFLTNNYKLYIKLKLRDGKFFEISQCLPLPKLNAMRSEECKHRLSSSSQIAFMLTFWHRKCGEVVFNGELHWLANSSHPFFTLSYAQTFFCVIISKNMFIVWIRNSLIWVIELFYSFLRYVM